MKLIKGLLIVFIMSSFMVSCDDTKKGVEKDLKEVGEEVEKTTEKDVVVTKETLEGVGENAEKIIDSVKADTEKIIDSAKAGTEKIIDSAKAVVGKSM